MTRENRRSTSLTSVALLVLAMPMAHATLAEADDWTKNEPAQATADKLDDHQASSENPDDLLVESRDSDDLRVRSESLDDHEEQSEDPDDTLTGATDVDDHEYTSESASDLRPAAMDKGFEAIEVPGQESWEPTTNAKVLVARRNLVRAQDRARTARKVYGDMIRHHYPRGDAQIRIIEERDASMQALEEAKKALEEAEN